MKIQYLLIPVLAMFLVTSCKKKKKDDAPKKDDSAKKVNKKPVVKKPIVKKPIVKKPVVKVVKKPVVAAPGAITTIAKAVPLSDIGLPPVALAIDFQKMVTTPIIKGLLDKNQAELLKGLETRDFSNVMKCMAYDAKKLYDIVNNLYVFADVKTQSAAILVKIKLDAFKMVECIGKNKKLFKAVKFDGKPAIFNIEDKGTSVAINKDTILITAGPAYASKIKIGKTDLGKGDVAKYFSVAGSNAIKLMIRKVAVKDLGPGAAAVLGDVKEVDVDGVIGFANGLAVKLGVNLNDPKKATKLANFAKMMLTGPNVSKQMIAMGIDPALVKNLVLTAKGSIISVDVKIPAGDVAKVLAIMDKKRPVKGAPGAVKKPAPKKAPKKAAKK